MQTKVCKWCGVAKDSSLYYKSLSTKDGLQVMCNPCLKIYNHLRYEKNKEQVARVTSLWKARNRERNNKIARICYWNTREKRLASMRRWKENNPLKHKIYANSRRARKTTAGGKFTIAEWRHLLTICDNRCLCCGETSNLVADHVIPISKGGTSWISNIQPLCKRCNNKKYTKILDYRNQKQILIPGEMFLPVI